MLVPSSPTKMEIKAETKYEDSPRYFSTELN